MSQTRAATTVNAGTISDVTGPGSLDLSGTMLYAVNFNGPTLTVNGVDFVSDNTPPAGFSSVGPQLVTAWQTKPEFGGTVSDDNLEQIYHDIRWTWNDGGNPPLQANMDVTPGQQYRLQVLFYGNHSGDNRAWDITVDGVLTVENLWSLGVSTGGEPAYDPNRGLVYSYDFFAPDSQVNVVFGQLGGAGPETPDVNAIWQGITLKQIPEPSTALLGSVAALGLLRRRRSRF